MHGDLECSVSRTAQASAEACLPLSLDWQPSVAQTHKYSMVNCIQDELRLKPAEFGPMFLFVSLPKSFTYNKHSH